jgi:hypothetical protein
VWEGGTGEEESEGAEREGSKLFSNALVDNSSTLGPGSAMYTVAVIFEIDANVDAQAGGRTGPFACAAAADCIAREAIVGGEYTGTPPGPSTPKHWQATW